jgi:PhnB protein
MQLQPYVFFNGRCEEAIEFYRGAIGAEVSMMMRFKDCPDPAQAAMITPGTENKVMHACLKIGDTSVMASDGRCTGETAFQGFALTITASDDDEARRLFAALGEGGTLQMPMNKTFFASSFGMLADRFGVTWMVIVPV